MRLRITAVSFFCRFLQETLEILEVPVEKNGQNFCMDDVIIMKFGQNVQNKILFTYLLA